MPGERASINLKRPDAEIEIGGEQFALRQFSSVAWRREQYTAVNQEAYRLYKQLSQDFADLTYGTIPLLPLMQRHLTETFVAAFTQVAALQAFLADVRRTTILAADEQTAVFTHIAAQRVPYNPTIQIVRKQRPFISAKRIAESIVRNILYLPRIRHLRTQKPPIPAPSPTRPRLLFHPYYPNHLPSFLPLIEKLKANGRFDIWVSGADTNTLRQGDIDPTP
ncbi:MAG: hypothetical protein KC413_16490, partial [Anaerolineales bacterium]|nr:hypothetical protein [Anaerolineales bacterium]